MRCVRPVLTAVSLFSAIIPAAAADPSQAVSFQGESTRWTLGAGVTVRSVDANFRVAKPDPLPWQTLLRARPPSGRGDVGVYSGGPRTVHYADGQVGPDYGAVYGGANPNGDAVGVIDSGSQLSATGRSDSFGSPIYDLAFHSSGSTYGYSSIARLHGTEASDSDVGVGPYLSLTYDCIQAADHSLGITLGWSRLETQHGTGARSLGSESVMEHRADNRYAYHYDYDGVGGAAAPGATFPFNANDPNEGFIVYDPGAYAANGNGSGYQYPRKNVQTRHSSHVAATVMPVASSTLALVLNEIVLAARYERMVNERLRLAVSAGPTLNVLDSDFRTTIFWRLADTGHAVATTRHGENSTDVQMGFMGQVSVSYDLSPRIFLEAHGSYRWVDPVTVGGRAASVEVDASSWEGGLGFGVRL